MKVQRFDVSQYLDSPEAIKDYLEIALEENGIEGVKRALDNVAKAKGMTLIAENANIDRGSLYKSILDAGELQVDAIYRVLESLGVALPIGDVERG